MITKFAQLSGKKFKKDKSVEQKHCGILKYSKVGKLTGNTKVKESTGRGPDLHDTVKPFTILSKRHKDSLFFAASPTEGIRSESTWTSSVTMRRKAVAMSSAQLHRGIAVHLESFTRAS